MNWLFLHPRVKYLFISIIQTNYHESSEYLNHKSPESFEQKIRILYKHPYWVFFNGYHPKDEDITVVAHVRSFRRTSRCRCSFRYRTERFTDRAVRFLHGKAFVKIDTGPSCVSLWLYIQTMVAVNIARFRATGTPSNKVERDGVQIEIRRWNECHETILNTFRN